MPLTVTKLLWGSVFSIISFATLYARNVSLAGFVLGSRRLLIDRLCFRRADVFKRNGFEQAVAHRTHLCQDEVDARITIPCSLIELDGLNRIRQYDRRRLARQEQTLV